MLTDEDINRLLAVLATKKDVEHLEEGLAKIQDTVFDMSTNIAEITKSLQDLHDEYAAIKDQTDRHDDWIHEIAKKANLKLKV
jgi:predicted  nucleic acid-binding Zn-ribbon protein